MNKKMKKFVSYVCLFSMLWTLVPRGLVFAATDDDFTKQEEVFDPNFIISDEEMQNWQSMTRTDIQAFLEEHNSYLATYKTQDSDGFTYPASYIIYKAAQDNQINPKYILVKLQKEQSLITSKNPTQKQLDWATGYSVCDSCKTTDPNIQNNRGFGMQVEKAAGIIRWYYENQAKERWIKTAGNAYVIDGQKIIPKSHATGFLYTYTPHIHGNKNFWLLWNRWFDQFYPNGTLVKSANSSEVYLIQDGKKRLFKSFSALTTRFDPKLIVTVPEAELIRYEEAAPISLPNFSLIRNAGVTYLVDYDKIRPFESDETVRRLGYHPDEIIEVTASDLSTFDIGKPISTETNPLGALVRLNEDNILYFYQEGILYPLPDENVARVNFSHLDIQSLSLSDLDSPEVGLPMYYKDGTIIQPRGGNAVYVIEDGKKRHISSEETFLQLGFDWDNIVQTSPITEKVIPSGEKIYAQVKNIPSGIIEDGEPAEPEVDYRDLMQRTASVDTKYIGYEYQNEIDAYLVADAQTGEILLGKNIDVVRPLASLTKVVTAYNVMRNGYSPNRVTTYEESDHKSIYHKFRAVEGEKFFNKDLLSASLISSLNTATRMLVDSVVEDEDTFVAQMNGLAKEWGLSNTKFVNVTGESEENVSTLREYLTAFQNSTRNAFVRTTLAEAGYKYSEFLDIDEKPEHFDAHSNSLRLRDDLSYTVLESKTGYLYESGANLAMKVKRNSDGKEFYVIIFGYADHPTRFDAFNEFTTWAMTEVN